MAVSSTNNVLNMISEKYSTLSTTQKRIADYVTQHPDICSFSTLKELANVTNTTEVTVLNFSKKLGFNNFVDMRNSLQGFISGWISPNEKIKTSIWQEQNSYNATSNIIDSEVKALRRTYSYIAQEDIASTLKHINEARKVYVIGSDYGSTVAYTFVQRFLRLGVDVTDISATNIPTMVDHLSLIKATDVLVLASFAPYIQLPIKLAAKAKELLDISIICLTDSLSSPGAALADVTLCTVTENSIFLNSMTAPMSLINLLACMYVLDYKDSVSLFLNRHDHFETVVVESDYSTKHWLL